jgi:hypothetical protein
MASMMHGNLMYVIVCCIRCTCPHAACMHPLCCLADVLHVRDCPGHWRGRVLASMWHAQCFVNQLPCRHADLPAAVLQWSVRLPDVAAGQEPVVCNCTRQGQEGQAAAVAPTPFVHLRGVHKPQLQIHLHPQPQDSIVIVPDGNPDIHAGVGLGRFGCTCIHVDGGSRAHACW